MNEKTYLSASAVMRAGRDLRDALNDPARLELAANRLASAAERSVAQLDDVATRAFQSSGVAEVAERTESVQDLLAAALSQMEVASTLLAASQAVGEQGAAEPAILDRSLHRLDDTIAVLTAQNRPGTQRFQAEAITRSATVEDARAAFGKQVEATLDAVISRSTGVIGKAVTGIHKGGPELVTKAWNWANEKLNLDEIGGKLAKIGMRAFNAALGILVRVFPSERLLAVRADVQNLIGEMSDGPAGRALVGAVLGAPKVAQATEQVLERAGLDRERLDGGAAELAALGARHDKQLELWSGLAGAIGYARMVTALVRITIPYLGVIIAAAHLIVVGAVVAIGRERVGEVGTVIIGAAG